MSSTKDIDPKVKAEIKAEQIKEDLRIRKAISEYDFADQSSVEPPEIAPKEYSKTAIDGLTYPLSLSALSSKFGGSGNLLSLLGKADGVPTSPPLAMSDFNGVGTQFRINGRINIDRWDSLGTDAGLYPVPSHTWDRNNNTWLGYSDSDDTMGLNRWRHSINNSFDFVTWMTNYRVTTIRNLSVTFTSPNTELHRGWVWTGLFIDSGGDLREITVGQRHYSNVLNQPVTLTVPMVINGAPNKNNVINDLWGDDMEKIRGHIAGGFLFRGSYESYDNRYDGVSDFYVTADFDVVPK